MASVFDAPIPFNLASPFDVGAQLIVPQNAIPRSFTLPIDLQGIGTAWLGQNPLTLFTVTGDATLTGVIIGTNTTATGILTTGVTIGNITITDTSNNVGTLIAVYRPTPNPNPGQRELRSGFSRQKRRTFSPYEQLGYSDFTN